MLAQGLSGNKKPSSAFAVVAYSNILPTGGAGSEYATINMTTVSPAAKVGDFMLMFHSNNDSGFAGGTIDGGPTGWTSDTYVWSSLGYTADFAYKTLAATDISATAMRFLARSTYRVVWIIVRSLVGKTLTGTLKHKQLTDGGTAATLTFNAYTKAATSKGHLMVVCDRDATATWKPPAGTTLDYSYSDGTFANAFGTLADPAKYASGTSIVWTTSGVTFGQTGVHFEIT